MKTKISVFLLAITMLTSYSSRVSAGGLNDGQIIGIYLQVNSFDIESALLAINRAHSKAVKNLAMMVSTDHRGVRLMAVNLASTIGVKVSLPDGRQQAANSFYQTSVDLSKLEGQSFDKAYLLYEIDFHTQAIKAVKTVLSPSSTNAKLKKHFETVLPHFEHHLAETTAIAKSLGYL